MSEKCPKCGYNNSVVESINCLRRQNAALRTELAKAKAVTKKLKQENVIHRLHNTPLGGKQT